MVKNYFGFAVSDSMFNGDCKIKRTTMSEGMAKVWIGMCKLNGTFVNYFLIILEG